MQRNQNTGQQLSLSDKQLIDSQQRRRHQNHPSSEKSKSGGKPALPNADVTPGSIVYMYQDGSKLRTRPRYVVLKVENGWVTVRRFGEKQLGHIPYTARLDQCYVVPEEVDAYSMKIFLHTPTLHRTMMTMIGS